MYTLQEIAAELGLSYYQVWRRLHRCNIPHEKRGKTIYADIGDFFYLPVGKGYALPKRAKTTDANQENNALRTAASMFLL